jgi:hypothetical protein
MCEGLFHFAARKLACESGEMEKTTNCEAAGSEETIPPFYSPLNLREMKKNQYFNVQLSG